MNIRSKILAACIPSVVAGRGHVGPACKSWFIGIAVTATLMLSAAKSGMKHWAERLFAAGAALRRRHI